MTTLICSHGMESGPGATKISALATLAERRGITALKPDYRDLPHWRPRLERLAALISAHSEAGPVLLLGSSIGAYISAFASLAHPLAGLFLLAPPIQAEPELPALDLCCANTWIVHGWHDELISPAQVVEFAQRHDARLLLISANHRLDGCVPLLERQFSEFLDLVAA